MGRKHILNAHNVLSGASIATNQASQVTNVEQLDVVSYYFNWTGNTPIGELFIEVSNDENTWYANDFGEQILISGNTGADFAEIDVVNWKFSRARYAAGSGTGTMTISIKGKGQGA